MRVIYLFLFLVVGGALQAQEKTLFEQATTHYKNGAYKSAIENYETILAKKQTSTAVYYNLANSYFKVDSLAASVYYYNKALQLSPNDRDVKNNLQVANERTIDDIKKESKTGFAHFIDELISTFTFNTWAVLAIVFSGVFMIFGICYYFSRRTGGKRFFFSLSVLALVFGVLSVVFAYQQLNIQQSREFAIVFAQKVKIHAEPNHNSEKVFTLHEGTKVKVLDNFNGYSKIKISDGNEGWINKDRLKNL